MGQHWLIKLILSPLSLLYGLVISARNTLYSMGVMKSSSFTTPVIGVGNLSMGGAGKTPHVEYLIRMLQPYIKLGVLSRGYMRKSRGYREVIASEGVDQFGDESLQYKLKFPELVVSVAERRALGIPMILGDHPDVQCVILDDAYQHRSVKPALNILITDYKLPYYKDVLLPSGRLREWRTAAKRAQIIIVSKCPDSMTKEERADILKSIKPSENQKVYFSRYVYGTPYNMYDSKQLFSLTSDTQAVVLTGIAKPLYLKEYLQDKISLCNMHSYEDHHDFSPHEVSQVKRAFDDFQSSRKVILTTEKDSTRLHKHEAFLKEHNLPVCILPIRVEFFDEDVETFDENIKSFLLNFKS